MAGTHRRLLVLCLSLPAPGAAAALSFSTYLGGTAGETAGYRIALDSAGSTYLTGGTVSLDFPLATPVPGSIPGGADVYVSKLDPSGSALVFTARIGGSLDDQGNVVALDPSGNIWLTGLTSSAGDFPAVRPTQPAYGGGFEDAFVVELDPGGTRLVFSTYLGGAAEERGLGIDTDASGRILVGGQTTSANFPTLAAAQPTSGGGQDAFVAVLGPSGTTIYATYVGGAGAESAFAVAAGAGGEAYVTGYTDSPNFPTRSPFQGALGGSEDAFVVKLDPGGAIAYSTFLGGGGGEGGYAISAGTGGEAWVAGDSSSSDFPLKDPLQGALAGSIDAFVSALDAAGGALVYSTYLGGSGNDRVTGLARDGSGKVYLAGSTDSGDFPLVAPYADRIRGPADVFVAALSPGASPLVYSTYLGSRSAGFDVCFGVAVDASGQVVVGGATSAADFPTLEPYQPALAGGRDAFVSRLCPASAATVGPVANTLSAVKEPGQRVHLRWQDVSPATGYSVYRDSRPDRSFSSRLGRAPDGAGGLTTPIGAGAIDYFRVAAATACGEGSK